MEIVNCYMDGDLTQKEVARRFRVSKTLVSRLYCLLKDDPVKFKERKHKEVEKQRIQALIKGATHEALNNHEAITSCHMI